MTSAEAWARGAHVLVIVRTSTAFHLTHPAQGCTRSPLSCPWHPAVTRWMGDHDRPEPGCYVLHGAPADLLSPWQHGRLLDRIEVISLERIEG